MIVPLSVPGHTPPRQYLQTYIQLNSYIYLSTLNVFNDLMKESKNPNHEWFHGLVDICRCLPKKFSDCTGGGG